MEPVTKEQLTEALQRLARARDDQQAWQILFAGSWATGLSASHRVLRGELDLAKDVTQEAFKRIVHYCNFGELDDADAFLAYLRAVCRNTARDALRQLVPDARALPLEELETTAPKRGLPDTPEQLLRAKQLQDQLLTKLDREDQQLLKLLVEGYSLSEIASRLGLSYPNAGVRLHRLRKTLRNYLKNKDL